MKLYNPQTANELTCPTCNHNDFTALQYGLVWQCLKCNSKNTPETLQTTKKRVKRVEDVDLFGKSERGLF